MFVGATIESWAADLNDVSLIYPWTGSEFIMAIAAIVAWIAWHFWQVGFEKREFDAEIERYGSKEALDRAIDDD